MTRIAIIAVAAVLAPGAVHAQDAERLRLKQSRAAALAAAGPAHRTLLPPGQSTRTRSYFRVEIHQGGVYEPSIFPTESWLEIACIQDDLQVEYDDAEHGFSLFRVHALVYDADLDLIHDTTETQESDEGICDASSSIDTTFVELSRADGRNAAAVALFMVPSTRQYIEASKLIYRILPE